MHSPKGYRVALPAALAALGLVSCGGTHQVPPNEASQEPTRARSSYQYAAPASEPGPTGATRWGATNRQPTDTLASAVASGVPSEVELSSLDDGQIAALMEAIDDAEIRMSQMAEAQTTDPEVKLFAHEMLAAHDAMLDADKLLWSRLHITSTASPVSGRLDADTQKEATRLMGMEGEAFDGQVRGHDNALVLFDRIIMVTKSVPLRTELLAARPKIEAHMRMAQSAQKGLTNLQPTTPVNP